jgi:CRISPR/Cas system-associated exonuclease Cas4 (RecB family)
MMNKDLQELRRKPHWSYSSLNTFLNICTLQWAFRYVYRHEPASTPAALVFGKVFHKALEYATRIRMDGGEPGTEETANLFCDLLSQFARTTEPAISFREGEDIDAMHGKGREMVLAYLQDSAGSEKVLGVSQAFSVFLKDEEGEVISKPLIGEFDCVVEVAGKPVIVDWKTAARRWPKNKERIELQPTCYLHAYRASGGNTDVLFRYDIITKAKTPVVDKRLTVRHASDTQRLVQQIKIAEKIIRSELFLPNDQSWACKGCPYGLACEGWHRERSRSFYRLELAA